MPPDGPILMKAIRIFNTQRRKIVIVLVRYTDEQPKRILAMTFLAAMFLIID